MKKTVFFKTLLCLLGLTFLSVFTPLCAQRPFPTGLPACLEDDFRQLEMLYDSTNGNRWRDHTNWFTANMGSWYGVTLSADNCSVKQLQLNGDSLKGTIPNFNLPNLQYLYLYDNQLTGTIPNFNLPNLHSLYLQNNQLTGTIPNFNLPKLSLFHIDNNLLTGTIPNFNLPNLYELQLDHNQLTGSIPNFNLPKLVRLRLEDNQLSRIPNFNLPNLLELHLANNRLTDTIPNFNMPILQRLILSNNRLTGKIPNFNMPLLELLSASDNQLTGSIPNFNMPRLIMISLSKNQLTGAIPNFNAPNIDYLYLYDNQLTGTIPNFNMPKLQHLYLYNNQLTGTIPNFNFPMMWSLALYNNQLTGTIPNFNADALQYLRIEHNQLNGRIPNFKLPKLKYLTLHYNQLSGCIPDSLRFQCPLIGALFGSISNNPGLTNQDWASYWNNGTGACVPQSTFNGGKITATLCGDRVYRLPSGWTVYAAGTYSDTIRHYNDMVADSAYQVQINIDTTCHCQDSIALASFYHSSGGYPNYWDLQQPMNTWAGLSLNAQGCVIAWWDAHSDTSICTQLNQNYLLYGDFGVFNALQLPNRWSKNGVVKADTTFLFLKAFQPVDTGRYTVRMLVEGQFSMLPSLQYAESRATRLKICCPPNNLPDCIASDTKDFAAQPWIKIYPNPSQAIFHLEAAEKLGMVRLYNGVGQWVKSWQTTEYQFDIDLTGAASGIYLLQVGERAYKILKQ